MESFLHFNCGGALRAVAFEPLRRQYDDRNPQKHRDRPQGVESPASARRHSLAAYRWRPFNLNDQDDTFYSTS
jgi:hypothetical protein